MGRSSHRRNLFLTAALRLNTTTGRAESRIHQAHITVTCPSPHDSRERIKRKDEILQGTKGRKASHQLSPVVANRAPCTADTS